MAFHKKQYKSFAVLDILIWTGTVQNKLVEVEKSGGQQLNLQKKQSTMQKIHAIRGIWPIQQQLEK